MDAYPTQSYILQRLLYQRMNTKTITSWAALGLAFIVPSTLISGDYYSGKEVYEPQGGVMFEESPYTVDLYGGASALYNSNTTQLSDGIGAWAAIFDFGFDFESANQGGRGSEYGFGYDGSAYLWENATAANGRDPLEHRVDGYYQINGGKTVIRLSSDYYRNNGNSVNFLNVNRESRSTQSDDLGLNASMVREITNGSLEVSAGYNLRDFVSGSGLNDQNSYAMDFALYHSLGIAPKTNYGVGFRFGSDDYSDNGEQDFYTTSLRWRYQASAKTTAYSTLGWETRSISGGEDSDNFVFDAGVNWEVSSKTSVNLFLSRKVRPSYNETNADFKSLGGTAAISHDLPGLYVLDARIGYENADYFSTAGGPGATQREDDFVRLGLSVSHPISLTPDINGSVSVFYNYNENDSSGAGADFDQSVTGLRLGFKY